MSLLGAARNVLLDNPVSGALVRQYRHLRTDCYVVSYPKAGRTWLRVLLGKLFALHCELAESDIFDPAQVVKMTKGRVPLVCFDHDGIADPLVAGRTHAHSYERYCKKKVVLLVRDPRDVLVSYYYHRTKRLNETFEMGDFLRDKNWGIDRMIPFMNDWYAHRDVPAEFLLLRYEDMHADIEAELERLLSFLGMGDVAQSVMREAADYASFDSMRSLSTKSLQGVSILRPKNPDDPESFKVRKGAVGGYCDDLSQSDIEFLGSEIDNHLDSAFGYSQLPSPCPVSADVSTVAKK
jgi:hypothetical protein